MSNWHAKATGGYTSTSTEGRDNARNMATILRNEGWNMTAICAMLGNGAGESGLNPWRWESDIVPTVAQFQAWTPQEAMSHGYGLFGFTPAATYINDTNAATLAARGYGPNFADQPGLVTDGNAQTWYFKGTVAGNWTHGLHDYYYSAFQAVGVDIDTFYYMTFDEFTAATDLALAVGAFELCYEKPAAGPAANSYANRLAAAQTWQDYFQQNPLTTMPYWLLGWWVEQKRRRYTR